MQASDQMGEIRTALLTGEVSASELSRRSGKALWTVMQVKSGKQVKESTKQAIYRALLEYRGKQIVERPVMLEYEFIPTSQALKLLGKKDADTLKQWIARFNRHHPEMKIRVMRGVVNKPDLLRAIEVEVNACTP